jgi:hypothetical protein
MQSATAVSRRHAALRQLRKLLRYVRSSLSVPTAHSCIRHEPIGLHGQRASILLLKENLSTSQRLQYERCGYFDVVGGDTGKCYRIWHGTQMNVECVDSRALCLKLCFMPKGRLPIGDIMLAQKIALELFESAVLAIANKSVADFPLRLSSVPYCQL